MDRFKVLAIVVCSLHCLAGSPTEQVTDSEYIYQEPPAYLHMCYKDDQDFNGCMAKTIYSIMKEMVHGIPEMGVPPIEPLVLEEVETSYIVGLLFKLKDIQCSGISKMVLTSIRGSLEERYFEVTATLDQALLSGNFEIYSPFFMHGRVTGDLRDINFYSIFHFEIAKRNNLDFLNVTSATVKITTAPAIGDFWLGGQRLDLIAEFVNLPFNARIITNTLRIALEPTFTAIMKKFAARLFGSMPYDVLVPDHRPRESNQSGITLKHLMRFLSTRLAPVPSPPLRVFSL